MPGASKIEIDCGECSFGIPATNDNKPYDTKMITGGHCLYDDALVQQPACFTNGDGKADQIFDLDNKDFGSVVAPDGEDGYDIYRQRLADYDGEFYPDRYISGIITTDSLRQNEGNTSYTVFNHGARTGRTSGYIKNVRKNSSGHVEVVTTAETGGGDSGCPLYREYENSNVYGVYIAGISVFGKGGSPGDDDCPFNNSGGNTMEYIETELEASV